MIGLPITQLSMDNQLCQNPCMTVGQLTGKFRNSREKVIPGHRLEVPQPSEKAVGPMEGIHMVVKIQVLIHVHMDHAVHRQGGLILYMAILEKLIYKLLRPFPKS